MTTPDPDPDRICPAPSHRSAGSTTPHAPPIYLASVYQCDSPAQADALLGGEQQGYVYARNAHPNADMLAERCRQLHAADHAEVTATGMAALSTALLALLRAGDHVVLGDPLYGVSSKLITSELARLGVSSTAVDACDLAAVSAAMRDETKLVVIETIGNPLMRVVDIHALAEIAHENRAMLLVDNTLATPILCRPLELGADLVMESLTKLMNGHGDVLLGLLCCGESLAQRVHATAVTWGLSSSPFDCYQALRGLGTLHLRAERACVNALAAAEYLAKQQAVEEVYYCGLAKSADHRLALDQFGGRFGHMLSFRLAGGREAADRFIAAAKRIPFCPSLGELCTTLSHPQSTSHRLLSAAEREALGIDGGLIRLSVGCESSAAVCEALGEGLAG
jgi:cystathionine beta-lyase/cystathionine gamma-synthase